MHKSWIDPLEGQMPSHVMIVADSLAQQMIDADDSGRFEGMLPDEAKAVARSEVWRKYPELGRDATIEAQQAMVIGKGSHTQADALGARTEVAKQFLTDPKVAKIEDERDRLAAARTLAAQYDSELQDAHYRSYTPK